MRKVSIALESFEDSLVKVKMVTLRLPGNFIFIVILVSDVTQMIVTARTRRMRGTALLEKPVMIPSQMFST